MGPALEKQKVGVVAWEACILTALSVAVAAFVAASLGARGLGSW